jgi:hypothetical protein
MKAESKMYHELFKKMIRKGPNVALLTLLSMLGFSSIMIALAVSGVKLLPNIAPTFIIYGIAAIVGTIMVASRSKYTPVGLIILTVLTFLVVSAFSPTDGGETYRNGIYVGTESESNPGNRSTGGYMLFFLVFSTILVWVRKDVFNRTTTNKNLINHTKTGLLEIVKDDNLIFKLFLSAAGIFIGFVSIGIAMGSRSTKPAKVGLGGIITGFGVLSSLIKVPDVASPDPAKINSTSIASQEQSPLLPTTNEITEPKTQSNNISPSTSTPQPQHPTPNKDELMDFKKK